MRKRDAEAWVIAMDAMMQTADWDEKEFYCCLSYGALTAPLRR